MRSIKKNAVIVTVLLFICAAVYLNWSYNKEVEEAAKAGVPALETDKSAPSAGEKKEEPESRDEGDAGLFYTVNSTAEAPLENLDDLPAQGEAGPYEEYFAQVRLERTQARDEAAATLAAVADAQGASQETVDGALKAMTELAQRAVQEAELENQIRAKGFIDCVVYLTDDRASVTVACEEGLTQSSVAKITDIIVSSTGLPAQKLTVTEIK